MARPAVHGLLTVALAVTMAPAASADDRDDRHLRKLKGIHSDRGFHTGRKDEDGGRNCRPHTFWRIHKLSPRNFFLPRTRYIDGPGGSMTVSVTREHEVLAFLEAENEKTKSLEKTRARTVDDVTDTKSVVEALRRLGLPHLEERHMVFTGHEYTREITPGKYGNMWYRVFGYRIGWSAWSVLGTCDRRKVAAGLANVPARVEGWRYWETEHPKFKRRILSAK
ncbi:hypothetical protein AB0K18_28475 [Nonomuraea sp. NPDC049421]|uniref:hypothetical protein n=1 Tax=Nonomuraea sp. NPDC049421 TaxID=3155275 RepID=UPI003414276E